MDNTGGRPSVTSRMGSAKSDTSTKKDMAPKKAVHTQCPWFPSWYLGEHRQIISDHIFPSLYPSTATTELSSAITISKSPCISELFDLEKKKSHVM